jgi:hypothetical protein
MKNVFFYHSRLWKTRVEKAITFGFQATTHHHPYNKKKRDLSSSFHWPINPACPHNRTGPHEASRRCGCSPPAQSGAVLDGSAALLAQTPFPCQRSEKGNVAKSRWRRQRHRTNTNYPSSNGRFLLTTPGAVRWLAYSYSSELVYRVTSCGGQGRELPCFRSLPSAVQLAVNCFIRLLLSKREKKNCFIHLLAPASRGRLSLWLPLNAHVFGL